MTKDRALGSALMLIAVLVGSILLLVVGFLARESWPALNEGPGAFFSASGWYPMEGRFGLLPMLWASLLITAGAIALAAPLGLMNAIALRFFLPPGLAAGYRALLALLAGIPSVVIGLWGLVSLVPLIALWQPPGAGLLTATLVLALMILPTVALTSSSALHAVPSDWLRGSAALGLSRWGTITGVALPAARQGIIGGMLLAMARAVGETLVVLMVAGNVVQMPSGLFDPVRTLTANIALEMAYAMDLHRSALFVSGLLLVALVTILALIAGRLGQGQVHAA
ncbi:MAG: phosphate ABC transporter permease subunit PstC [Wenzhouxiangellaceae bacterium]|nr:phosphate ABC transporter permease subunit PstC [Wenzhouxiangellaceae bacterium]